MASKNTLTHVTLTGLVDTRKTHHDYKWVVEISTPPRPDKRHSYDQYDRIVARGGFGDNPPEREETVSKRYRRAMTEYDEWKAKYGDHNVVLSWHSREDLARKAAAKAEQGWAGREGRTVTAQPVRPEAPSAKPKAKPAKPSSKSGLTKNQLAVLTHLAGRKQAVLSVDVQTETGLSGMQVGGVVPSLVQRKLVTRGSEDGSLVITREGKEALA